MAEHDKDELSNRAGSRGVKVLEPHSIWTLWPRIEVSYRKSPSCSTFDKLEMVLSEVDGLLILHDLSILNLLFSFLNLQLVFVEGDYAYRKCYKLLAEESEKGPRVEILP